jgi:hypothetical protein
VCAGGRGFIGAAVVLAPCSIIDGMITIVGVMVGRRFIGHCRSLRKAACYVGNG